MDLAPSLRSLLDRPEVARRLGPFVLVHQLGRGGFAPVWLAREVYDGVEIRRVAVKLFAFDRGGASEEARARVMEEARLLCRVEHPNIPRFYSLMSDEASGVLGLIMEHVEGASLEKKLQVRKKLPVVETLSLGIAIASALSAIHRAGLVHRDVKPSNMIDAGGTYKLIDFGIASSGQSAQTVSKTEEAGEPEADRGRKLNRILKANLPADAVTADMTTFSDLLCLEDGTKVTGDQGLMPAGTPGYIDPRCLSSLARATPSSDLYALGVTLFECLTGKLPSVVAAGPGGGYDAAVLDGRAESPPVGEHASDVPEAFAALIDSLLSPRREKRPASAEAVVSHLERIRAERLGRKVQLPPEEVGPFRGLGRFEGADRDVYFGRSAEVAATLDLLRRRGLVTLVGASGAGKSSLARAGVAPLVAEEGLGGFIKKWDVVITAPGHSPRESIVAALSSLVPNAESLEPHELADKLARGAESRGKGVLLVIDQLEEIVTVAEKKEALWLAELLAKIADPPHPFVRALGAARRDLLDPMLGLGPLAAVLPRSLLVVLPMSYADWASAIDQALSAYGYSFEDAELRSELLTEIEARAAAMPLVQFALTELWKRRDSKRKIIPRAGVSAIGGLSGALERHAEATLREVLWATDLPLMSVREVLLAMTTPQGTRAARTLDELTALAGEDAKKLTDALEAARLLVREEDGITLAHDSLLTEWWRLRDWISTAREDRFLAEDIEKDAARWAKENEDPSLLWKKRRLDAAEDLLRVGLVKLSPLAERFVRKGRPMARRVTVVFTLLTLLTFGAAALAGAMLAKQSSSSEQQIEEQAKEIASLRAQIDDRRRELCEESDKLRSRAEGALSQGRPLRALRILKRADQRCPGDAPKSAHLQLKALADIRILDEFDALANQIKADPRATALAREALAGRPDAADPSYKVALREGEDALARGDLIESRRKLDRVIHLLESQLSEQLTVGLPRNIDGEISALGWSNKLEPQLTVVHGGSVSVIAEKTGGEISRLPLSPGGFALSSEGLKLAMETPLHGVKIIDTSTGIPAGMLPDKAGAIEKMALSTKPERLVVARQKSRKVEVWGAQGSALLGELTIAGGAVTAVAISDDGKFFAVAMSDGSLTVHSMSSRITSFGVKGATTLDVVKAVALSPDGGFIAWGTEGGLVQVAPVYVESKPVPLGSLPGPIRAVQFSRDGKRVLAASSDMLSQWNVADGGRAGTETLPDRSDSRVIGSAPDGSIAVGGERAPIMVYGKTEKKAIGKDLAAARAIGFSPMGGILYTVMDDHVLRAFSLTRGVMLPAQRATRDALVESPAALSLAVSPDGSKLLSGGGGEPLRLWGFSASEPTTLLPASMDGPVKIVFSNTGEHALSISSEGKLRLFRVSPFAEVSLSNAPERVLDAAFRADDKEVVAVGIRGDMWKLDRAKGSFSRYLAGKGEPYKAAVLFPDLKKVVLWRHHALELYSTDNMALLRELRSPGDAGVGSIVLSPDGASLYTANEDRTLRKWSADSGALLTTFTGADRPIESLAVSPAGGFLAAATDDGVVLLFHEGKSTPSATIVALRSKGRGESAFVASPEGHIDFLGPEPCLIREKVACRIGPVRLPFDVCEDRFFSPGLLRSLSGEDSAYSERETRGYSFLCMTAPQKDENR